MNQAYHIKHWNDWYESSETRKLKTLTYYGKSNKLVGEGIGCTLAQQDNVALLGTWALIEALASTAERELRGWLIRNGTPLTAVRMSALLGGRVSAETFDRALQHFVSPEVGWLELVQMPGETADLPPQKPATPPQPGTVPVETPATLPATATGEREVGRDSGGKGEKRERGRDDLPASHLPSLKDREEFCAASRIPRDFVDHKLAAAEERKDFAKAGWRNGWREKLTRFWQTDQATWGDSKKNAAPKSASGRPDGWKEGDRERWWTDALDELQAEFAGAVLGKKDSAPRLREILQTRGKK